MKSSLPWVYIGGSAVAALIAAFGVLAESPLLYAIVPGLIGGTMAGVATVRFLKHKVDLAGFVATTCGFVFYQAFQANPVTLPEFSAGLDAIALPDKLGGIVLGNFTAGMILLAKLAVDGLLRRPLQAFVPPVAAVARGRTDRNLLVAFLLVFLLVAMPNILFGKVVIGAFKNILYQRASWAATGEFTGFEVWGGVVGASLVNLVFWSTSLFLLWLYLLGSRFRIQMLLVSPLVLLWTASVALQGSRTYLVTLGFALVVYLLGDPKLGRRTYFYGALGLPLLFALLQIATFYRSEGLRAVNFGDLAKHIFEIRGNEGTSSQMDGLEYFRTELMAKDAVPNPVIGLARGLVERPVEGILMPVPRALFPWKPMDDSGREFSLFFQNVRLGVPSDETFLGASPGLMGRELIRYGYLGPVTVLFWLGLVLALADRLYATAPASAFHRIFATMLIAFFVAQMRDWVPLWFLPFLPAMVIFGYVAWRAPRRGPVRRDRRWAESRPVAPGSFLEEIR